MQSAGCRVSETLGALWFCYFLNDLVNFMTALNSSELVIEMNRGSATLLQLYPCHSKSPVEFARRRVNRFLILHHMIFFSGLHEFQKIQVFQT